MSKHKHRITKSDEAAVTRFEKLLPDIDIMPPIPREPYPEDHSNILLGHITSVGAKVLDPAAEALACAPYHTEEKTFTTRQGGPDTATLMGEYINRYAIGTGASLLMVHPIPANNSFLFIWENP